MGVVRVRHDSVCIEGATGDATEGPLREKMPGGFISLGAAGLFCVGVVGAFESPRFSSMFFVASTLLTASSIRKTASFSCFSCVI